MAEGKIALSEKLPPSPTKPSPALTGDTFVQGPDLEDGVGVERQSTFPCLRSLWLGGA